MIETANSGPSGQLMAEPDNRFWALVPVKILALAKQRLADSLGTDRKGLAFAMLKDVLSALGDSEEVCQVAVVTADPDVVELVKANGHIAIMEETDGGLNAAIECGVEAIRKSGGERAVIVPADIPLISGKEIDRLVRSFEFQRQENTGGVIGLSPSTDRGGTNCLIIDTDQRFSFRYGPDSFELHRKSAWQHQYSAIFLYSPIISRDIDEPGDVDAMVLFCRENPEYQRTETWKFLQSAGLTTDMLAAN